MQFHSDNITGCAPEVLEALIATNAEKTRPYGADLHTERAEAEFRRVFETDLDVIFVATGTAANALALASITPDYGAIFCVKGAHIEDSEGGAIPFLSGGAEIVPIEAPGAKMSPERLSEAISSYERHARFRKPSAVSITQASELGTVYTASDLAALASVAHDAGLKLHVDGARWANALVSTGETPADLSWRVGVDVLSLGATKNGAMAAEAVVYFDRRIAEGARERRKRSGMLLSKHRFLAVQFEAYLKDDLWIRLARHANAQAQRLAKELSSIPGIEIAQPVEANEVFARLPVGLAEKLTNAGGEFHQRKDGTARFVASFATTEGDISALVSAVLSTLSLADNADPFARNSSRL